MPPLQAERRTRRRGGPKGRRGGALLELSDSHALAFVSAGVNPHSTKAHFQAS